MAPDRNTLDALRIDRDRAPGRGRGVVPAAVVLVALAGAAAAGWWWWRLPGAVAVRTVVAREAAGGGERTLLNASGYVTARREATVSSKITGQVVEVLVEEGMKVEANQVLARLDASNLNASLALAQARLEAARQARAETLPNLEQARREQQRLEELVAARSAKQLELDRAATEVKSLAARLQRQELEVQVAEREVAIWQQQRDDAVIRAPFAGIVTAKNAQPGEMVSPLSAGGGYTRTGICTIVDMSSLEIEVDVNESYINRVKAGQPVVATLDSYPDWRIPARVIAIIPTADRQKATVKVRVGLEQVDNRVLPDMSVKVAFQGDAPAGARPGAEGGGAGAAGGARAVVVPGGAIGRRDGREVVWVVRDGRVERRAVAIAAGPAAGDDQWTIAAGVSAGERLVVDAPADLADGAAVTEAK